MKIWNSYGSEHSANLVMIGKFQDETSAEKTKEMIDEISEYLQSTDENYYEIHSYPSGVLDLLKRIKFHDIRPEELSQFNMISNYKLKGDTIVLTTDESDISGFLKLFVSKGARVEVYSAHDYPNTGKGR